MTWSEVIKIQNERRTSFSICLLNRNIYHFGAFIDFIFHIKVSIFRFRTIKVRVFLCVALIRPSNRKGPKWSKIMRKFQQIERIEKHQRDVSINPQIFFLSLSLYFQSDHAVAILKKGKKILIQLYCSAASQFLVEYDKDAQLLHINDLPAFCLDIILMNLDLVDFINVASMSYWLLDSAQRIYSIKFREHRHLTSALYGPLQGWQFLQFLMHFRLEIEQFTIDYRLLQGMAKFLHTLRFDNLRQLYYNYGGEVIHIKDAEHIKWLLNINPQITYLRYHMVDNIHVHKYLAQAVNWELMHITHLDINSEFIDFGMLTKLKYLRCLTLATSTYTDNTIGTNPMVEELDVLVYGYLGEDNIKRLLSKIPNVKKITLNRFIVVLAPAIMRLNYVTSGLKLLTEINYTYRVVANENAPVVPDGLFELMTQHEPLRLINLMYLLNDDGAIDAIDAINIEFYDRLAAENARINHNWIISYASKRASVLSISGEQNFFCISFRKPD